jgi:hypothetical protein
VTTPNASLQLQAAQQLIDKASDLWVAAGEKSDSADGLGIDGRINLVHDLIDLWAKSSVAIIEALIKGGPIFGPGSSVGSEPMPSEVIEVMAQTYQRQIVCDELVRVGLPGVKVSPSSFAFDPPFVPAGVTKFRIVLKDYHCIGSNYTGKITFKRMGVGATSIAPDEKVVTVGL